MLENIKQKIREYVDTRTVVSVIAAGAVLGGAIYGLRKAGLNKAASVVAKAK